MRFRARSEKKLLALRRQHDGRIRSKGSSADWKRGGLNLALRDIALALKKWAQNEQMMGSNYPARPQYDVGLIRTFFSQAGVPHVTRILQDRQISYIGVNDITNDIIVFTRKKPTTKEKRILAAAASPMIGGQQISLQFKYGNVAHVGGVPSPPIGVPPFALHGDRYTCGSSIYIGSEKGAGTLGCLVRNQNGELFGLSNNHVTGGCNYAVPGLPIIAPGILDIAAGGQDPETLGHHHAAQPFVDGIPDVVDATHNLDAAIFKIANPDRVSSMQRASYDTPSDCVPMSVGMRVSKVGRTTGATHGEVVAELPDCNPVVYDVDICAGHKLVYFKELFVIQATNGNFTEPGDSGSLVVNIDAQGIRRGTGIVIGGDGTGLTFALSLHRVLEHFNVELVAGHNA
jgi:hypothetical protein